MANREACEVYIEQEIKEGLAEGKTPYSIGKEISSWLETKFAAIIPASTIERRAERIEKKLTTNVVKLTPTNQYTSEIPEKVPAHRPAKYQAPPTFNRQTGDGIEWAGWSWNPVTGCLHGCDYCYARAMTQRFPESFPRGFKPTFRKHLLTAPQNTPIPNSSKLSDRLVFTVSMGDLFGEWVPQEWIDAVLDSIHNAPDHWIFLFLTKNPKRLPTINFPDNAWVGATADTQDRATEIIEIFSTWKDRPQVLFMSCEPLRERIDLMVGSIIDQPAPVAVLDWLIIGGQSGAQPSQPEWEWVELLHDQARENDINIYYKPNLTVRPKEYPGNYGD